MSERKNPITSEHIALAQTFAPRSGVYALADDAPAMVIPAKNSRDAYHLVYTANTGCGGGTGATARHNTASLREMNKTIPVDYINTNYWSDDPRGSVVTESNGGGVPVPGKQIARVSRGGQDATTGSDLGKALFSHYNLGPLSTEVVLVFVTDPNDRKKDRVIQRFENTFGAEFINNVTSAVQRDQAQSKGRTGIQRS